MGHAGPQSALRIALSGPPWRTARSQGCDKYSFSVRFCAIASHRSRGQARVVSIKRRNRKASVISGGRRLGGISLVQSCPDLHPYRMPDLSRRRFSTHCPSVSHRLHGPRSPRAGARRVCCRSGCPCSSACAPAGSGRGLRYERCPAMLRVQYASNDCHLTFLGVVNAYQQ
jgi:hypothetical protein